MRTRLPVLCFVLLALSACGAAPAPAIARFEDPSLFSRLASGLVGTWRTEGGTQVDYAWISNESALVETWTSAGGSQTLTVYHPDHDEVRLTHYCAQGNQARLRLTAAEEATFRFEREAVTNLLPGQSILTVLELRVGGEVLDRAETYVDQAGVPELSELHFVRVPPT